MNPTQTETEKAEFANKVFRGGRSLILSQIGRFVLRVCSTLIVARMLTPDDYGVFGMSLVIYSLVYTVKDLGLLSAAVSSSSISPGQQNRTFWLSSIAGVFFSAFFCAIGPIAAKWDGEPRLIPIFFELSSCFLICGLGTYPQMMLSRQLRYGELSAIEIISMVVSVAVAVVSAMFGNHYWALVHMTVAAELTRTVSSWWMLGEVVPRVGEGALMRGIVMLGLSIAGFSAISYTSQSCDQFLIGLWFGSRGLGLYGRATQFTLIPAHFLLGPISGWMTAALSRLREDPERYRALNRQVSNAVAHVIYPLAAVFFAAPSSTILLLLGPNWVGAGPILKVLSIGLLAQPILFAQNWLLVSRGHGRRLCTIAITNLILLAILCMELRPWGLAGISAAVSCTAILNLATAAWAVQSTPVRLVHDVLVPLWRPFVLFVILASAVWSLVHFLPRTNLYTVISLSTAGGIWIACALGWPATRVEWKSAARAFGGGSGTL